MRRSLYAAILALLAAPGLAAAADAGGTANPEQSGDQVTEFMFILIIAAILILGIVAAFEARRQK